MPTHEYLTRLLPRRGAYTPQIVQITPHGYESPFMYSSISSLTFRAIITVLGSPAMASNATHATQAIITPEPRQILTCWGECRSYRTGPCRTTDPYIVDTYGWRNVSKVRLHQSNCASHSPADRPSSPPFRVRTAEPSPVLRVAPRTAKGTRGTPNTRLPRTSFPRSPKWPIKFQAHNPDRWRTPEEWDASPCAELPCSDVERQLGMTNKQEDSSLSDLASVRSELKKMEQLARRSILFRFQEKLAGLQNPSAYRETEMGNKRLMLFALGALDRSRHVYPAASTPSAPRLPLSSRILALFETEGKPKLSTYSYRSYVIT